MTLNVSARPSACMANAVRFGSDIVGAPSTGFYYRREPYAQSTRERDLAVSTPARRQSRRLVSVGRRGADARARRGQADPALGRLLGLSLVSRDGARVVRGRGHRAPHERAL